MPTDPTREAAFALLTAVFDRRRTLEDALNALPPMGKPTVPLRKEVPEGFWGTGAVAKMAKVRLAPVVSLRETENGWLAASLNGPTEKIPPLATPLRTPSLVTVKGVVPGIGPAVAVALPQGHANVRVELSERFDRDVEAR